MGSQFHVAFGAFRAYFAQQTGIDWLLRPWGQRAQVPRKVGAEPPTGCEEGGGRRAENRFFTYLLPRWREGEPLGEVLWNEGRERWGEPGIMALVGGGLVRYVQEEEVDEEVGVEVGGKRRRRTAGAEGARVRQRVKPWPEMY